VSPSDSSVPLSTKRGVWGEFFLEFSSKNAGFYFSVIAKNYFWPETTTERALLIDLMEAEYVKCMGVETPPSTRSLAPCN